MTTEVWHAGVSQWGDTIWQLAVLMHNNSQAARVATARAFVAVYATPPADPLPALVQTLLRQRQLHPPHRRMLPSQLAQLAPADRLLLGLWLVQNHSGSQLATLAGVPPAEVVARLQQCLLAVLSRHDPAHTTVGRAALATWLAQQLALPVPDMPAQHTAVDMLPEPSWPAAAEHLRTTLRSVVGAQHLPHSCRTAIETALRGHYDVEHQSWWQMPALQRSLAVAVLLVLLLFVIAPWARAPASTAAPSPAAAELVHQALAAWDARPAAGTLHRRVWALDEQQGELQPVQADVWLAAGSPRHRIEVRQGEHLVEWQIADGTDRLLYGAGPGYSACTWAAQLNLLDRRAREYPATPDQQRIARDAWLTQGAYGLGYRMLQAALDAPDLRSLGTRTEDDRPVALLSYTWQQLTETRTMLLVIDLETRQLHAVRAVIGDGNQTSMRELWRLEAHEPGGPSVSTTKPRWTRPLVQQDHLLTPACPGLHPQRVYSLRQLLQSGWGWHLPRTLPADTSLAALISTTGLAQNAYDSVVLVGEDRWLQLSSPIFDTSGPAYRDPSFDDNAGTSDAIQRGLWRVQISGQGERLQTILCRPLQYALERWAHSPCALSFNLNTVGWMQSDLLAFIDTLAPVDAQLWAELDPAFLDPQPLDPQVRSVLVDTLTALQPHQNGMLYTRVEQRIRVEPQRQVLQDPYHVPLAIAEPERVVEEQWGVYANGQVTQIRRLRTTPDGILLETEVGDTTQYMRYSAVDGQRWIDRRSPAFMWGFWDRWPPITDAVLSLLTGTEPITLAEKDGKWVLEQVLARAAVGDGRLDTPLFLHTRPWVNDLPLTDFALRITVDQASALPQQALVLHIDEQGHETVLGSLQLTDWRSTPGVAKVEGFKLPPLPEDTITLEFRSDSPRWAFPMLGDGMVIEPPSRTLVWPQQAGFVMEVDHPIDPAVFNRQAPEGQQILWAGLVQLDTTGFVRFTRYRMPADGRTITIRQGPRIPLRYNLRHSALRMYGQGGMWQSSEPVKVVMADQPRTAWLLQSDLMTVLVVEVDELLLHISTPDAAYLKGPLLAQLSKLEWEETRAQASDKAAGEQNPVCYVYPTLC